MRNKKISFRVIDFKNNLKRSRLAEDVDITQQNMLKITLFRDFCLVLNTRLICTKIITPLIAELA